MKTPKIGGRKGRGRAPTPAATANPTRRGKVRKMETVNLSKQIKMKAKATPNRKATTKWKGKDTGNKDRKD